MKVKKKTLLLVASIVWMIAGFNVARLGIISYQPYLSLINVALSILVFGIFAKMIFLPMHKKHTKRIMGYEEEKQNIFKFFDVKAYIIMTVMMGGGILIRNLHIVNDHFVAVFYTGLGLALFMAGVCFVISFIKVNKGFTNK